MAEVVKSRSFSDFLRSRSTMIILQLMLCFAVTLIAIAHRNAFPIITAAFLLPWFLIGWLGDTAYQERRKSFFSTEHWAVFGPAVVVVLSSFVLMPFNQYCVIIRGDEIQYKDGWFLTVFNPVADATRTYSLDQTVYAPGKDDHGTSDKNHGTWCAATSADGKGVQAAVAAELALPFEGLPAAYAISNDQHTLTRMVKSELCARFANAISRYTLVQIPAPFILESDTAEAKQGMNKMGVLYSGVIHISDMHAYVSQVK